MRTFVVETSLVAPGEHTKAVLDLLPIGVVTCDGAGVIRLYNEHAVKLWGRRPALGDRFTGAMRLRRRTGEPLGGDAPLARALRSGRAVEPIGILIERGDGTVIAVESYASPLHDELGACVGAVELLRERVSVPQELVDLRHETDAFVRLTQEVSAEISRARVLALDVRALSVERFDLARMVVDVTERYAERAREAASPITVDGAAIAVHADRSRLDQVVAQLLANALDFGRGLPIEVSIAQVGARAQVAVRDRGLGVAREHHGAIFDRFEVRRGNGLWMARRLVEAMAGTLDVASEPGFGATFTVALPTA